MKNKKQRGVGRRSPTPAPIGTTNTSGEDRGGGCGTFHRLGPDSTRSECLGALATAGVFSGGHEPTYTKAREGVIEPHPHATAENIAALLPGEEPVLTFNRSEIAALEREYAELTGVKHEDLPKFHAIFERCSNVALAQLASARIKYVSRLAFNACKRRGIDVKPAARQTRTGHADFGGYTVDALVRELLRHPSQARVVMDWNREAVGGCVTEVRSQEGNPNVFISNTPH